MKHFDFIMGIEDGTLTEEEFFENVQSFVDSGIWRSLQGSWQRAVYNWVENGYCVIL